MWTNNLDERNAIIIQHLVDLLLDIDDKVGFLNPTEYNALSEILNDVKEYRAKFSTK